MSVVLLTLAAGSILYVVAQLLGLPAGYLTDASVTASGA